MIKASDHTSLYSWAKYCVEQYGAMQNPRELAWLGSVIGSPRAAIEIGSHKGGVLAFLLGLMQDDGMLISIDVDQSHNQVQDPRLYKVQAPSNHLSHYVSWMPLWKRKVDFIFIDGDHSSPAISQDYYDYRPLMRPGGYMAFHDLAIQPALFNVMRKEEGEWSELILEDPKYATMGIGVLRVPTF